MRGGWLGGIAAGLMAVGLAVCAHGAVSVNGRVIAVERVMTAVARAIAEGDLAVKVTPRSDQDALGRAYHLENPSNYLGFTHSTMTETEFLNEVVERTGCRLLCDVSNIHVSAHNLGYDAHRYINELPGAAIGEFHLGGFEMEDEAGGTSVIIDTHVRPIDASAWDLYAYAVARFGRRPTLIEWDSAVPDISVLLDEAAKADTVARAALKDMTHAAAV